MHIVSAMDLPSDSGQTMGGSLSTNIKPPLSKECGGFPWIIAYKSVYGQSRSTTRGRMLPN